MTTLTTRPEGLVNLLVRFGNQIRHRCARCHHFFKPVPGASIAQCRCGASYEPVAEGLFSIVGWPE